MLEDGIIGKLQVLGIGIERTSERVLNWYSGTVVIVADHRIRSMVSKDWWCSVSTVDRAEERAKEVNWYKG